jgi:hypothetical protein
MEARMFRKWLAFFMILIATAVFSAPLPQNDQEQPPPKTYQFVDQRAGDCHLSGVLTLHSDGRAHWDATTWTDSSTFGDIWHSTLKVLDANNQELLGFGVWDSPIMYPGGGQYHWTKDATFAPEFFNQVATATSEGSC